MINYRKLSHIKLFLSIIKPGKSAIFTTDLTPGTFGMISLYNVWISMSRLVSSMDAEVIGPVDTNNFF